MASTKDSAVTKDYLKQALTGVVTAITKRMDIVIKNLETRLSTQMEEGFREVTEGFHDHDKRFDRIDSKLIVIDDKLEHLENDVEEIKLERTRYVSHVDFDEVRERVEILEKTTHSHAKGKRVK
jgi:hypothetical protein